MKRRNFLKTVGSMAVLSQLPTSTHAEEKETTSSESASQLKEIRKISIHVGVKTPFSVLHISDSHLTRTDDRDNERKKKLSQSRKRSFPNAEKYFEASIDYARTNNLPLLHT